MAWRGLLLGTGVVLAILGFLGVVVGLGIAVVGPGAVDDMAEGEGDGSRSGGFLGLGANDDDRRATPQDVAEARIAVRAAGAMVAAAGGAVLLLGGVLYAVGRGGEAERRAK